MWIPTTRWRQISHAGPVEWWPWCEAVTWPLVKMETVFCFVGSFRLNPGGKTRLGSVTAVSICLFLIYGWIKPPVNDICFTLACSVFYKLPLKRHWRAWCKPRVWSSQSRVLEGTLGAGLVDFLLRSKSVSFNGPFTGPFVSLIHCGAWAESASALWHFIGQ